MPDASAGDVPEDCPACGGDPVVTDGRVFCEDCGDALGVVDSR